MSRTLPYELIDQARETRLGVIVLSTDESLEYEFGAVLAGHPVNLLHSRIPAEAEVTPGTLATMAARMSATAALLPSGLDAIAYACTSGATVIGPQEVARLIRAAHPDIPVADPLSAVRAALKALKARRIALVSPYVASVTAPLRAALAESGVEVVSEVSFDQSHDQTVSRIDEASTLNAMRAAVAGRAVDAVFASCTNLRSFGIIDAAEAGLGVPVVSSNSALLWHMLQIAGVAAVTGPGRLFVEGVNG